MKCPYKKKVTKTVTTERYTNITKTCVTVDFMECSMSECPFYYEHITTPKCIKAERIEVK